MRERDFDAIFYPAATGHSGTWQKTRIRCCSSTVYSAEARRRGLPRRRLSPQYRRNGEPGQGKRATAFSNSEEEAVGLSKVVPFSLEDMLSERGAVYQKAEDWAAISSVTA